MSNTNDTPKKTLTLTRKPAAAGTSTTAPTGTITRTGKRIITRDQLPNVAAAVAPKRSYYPKPNQPNKAKDKGGKKKPPRKPPPKKKVTPPSDLKAKELNDRLNGFPVWLNYQPLAIGVDKDLFRLVNDEHFPGASKKVVQKVLARHTKHGRYLQAVINGSARYRLDGTEDGEINAYQRQLAAEILAKRLQAKP